MVSLEDVSAAQRELLERLTPPSGRRQLSPRGSLPRGAWPRNEDRIHAVGFGPREVRGVLCSDIAIRTYVRRKLPREALSVDRVIPTSVGGLWVDVVEEPVPRAQSSPLSSRLRPLEMGLGISNEKALDGTLGAIVTWRGREGRFLLSCSHVLAPVGLADPKDWIVQPPINVARPATENLVGRLEEWTRIGFGSRDNWFDAAVARLEPGVAARNDLGVPGVSLRPGNFLSEAGQRRKAVGVVVKRGAASGITEGRVIDWAWDGEVLLRDIDGRLRPAFFRDQLRVASVDSRPFSAPGDSGALVVEKDTSSAVGLVIAGGQRSSVVTPAWRVLAIPDRWQLDLEETQ